ncbi:putative orphan protein [Pseudoalteromonas translucida]|uniref:Orphan protein n=1 Tax=Pseudoalteromonas translucida (strain TAC 125) TaxID=326442 RepID=Q3IED1_PSET1|nr:putative orphan protein [Pseudoalteromonas translucida]
MLGPLNLSQIINDCYIAIVFYSKANA